MDVDASARSQSTLSEHRHDGIEEARNSRAGRGFRGGRGLRYSFDIKNGKHTQEVGVDAKTGNRAPVIVITARDGVEERVKGRDLGADVIRNVRGAGAQSGANAGRAA